MPRTATPRELGGGELGERHREVLREALRLFAERGYAGASLRELARRVGMQQPSLYHYFRSKEELVEQILVTFGFGGVEGVPEGTTIPDRIEDLPRALGDVVVTLYERTEWATFVAFMFTLSFEQPQYRERLRAMLVDRVGTLMKLILEPYVTSGQLGAKQAEYLSRMVLSAVALPYIEEKVLFRGAGTHGDLREYADFVVRVAELALTMRDRLPS